MVFEAGARIVYDSTLIYTEVEDRKITRAIFYTKGGYMAVKAKIFIDGTGDGDVAALAGVPFEVGGQDFAGLNIASTLGSRWAGVNIPKYEAAEKAYKEEQAAKGIKNPKNYMVVLEEEAIAKGELTRKVGNKNGFFKLHIPNTPPENADIVTFAFHSYYCHNTASNSDKPQTYSFSVPVGLWSVDAQYQHPWFIVRGNILSGHVGNSTQLSAKNVRQSNNSPYSRLTPVAKRAVSYGAEGGLRLRNWVYNDRMPDLIPFVRYEYYNAQESVEVDAYNLKGADPRLKTSMWVAGLNYRPLPSLIIKADYTKRRIGGGNYRGENEFALGVAFTGWFLADNRLNLKNY